MTTAELLADRVISRGSLRMKWERRKDETGATMYTVVDKSKRVIFSGLRYGDAVTIIGK